jgi:isopenicillin N synthase-like dioxygenase
LREGTLTFEKRRNEAMKLRLVNLSGKSANRFVDALQRDGIVAVVGHGIDSNLLQKKQQYDEKLFSLPTLSRYIIDPERMGEIGGYCYSPNKNDTRHVWQVIPTRNPALQELPDFLPLSIKLLHEYKRLFYTILTLINKSLCMPEGTLRKIADSATPMLRSWECYKKANIPKPPKFRVDEHADGDLLTILPIPKESGYEAYVKKCWTPIFLEDFPPHTLLIHGGRTLQRSAGIHPCLHRVAWTKNSNAKRITSLFGVRFAEY